MERKDFLKGLGLAGLGTRQSIKSKQISPNNFSTIILSLFKHKVKMFKQFIQVLSVLTLAIIFSFTVQAQGGGCHGGHGGGPGWGHGGDSTHLDTLGMGGNHPHPDSTDIDVDTLGGGGFPHHPHGGHGHGGIIGSPDSIDIDTTHFHHHHGGFHTYHGNLRTIDLATVITDRRGGHGHGHGHGWGHHGDSTDVDTLVWIHPGHGHHNDSTDVDTLGMGGGHGHGGWGHNDSTDVDTLGHGGWGPGGWDDGDSTDVDTLGMGGGHGHDGGGEDGGGHGHGGGGGCHGGGKTDVTTTLNVQLMPNPASNYVTVNAGAIIAQYQLFDNAGRVVRANNVGEQSTTIQLDGLVRGVYILKITTTDNQTSSKQIVVQ